MGIYSYSRLGTFQRCSMQYKYKYIDNWKRTKKSFSLLRGLIVHEQIERLTGGVDLQSVGDIVARLESDLEAKDLEKYDIQYEAARITEAALYIFTIASEKISKMGNIGDPIEQKAEENIRFEVKKNNGQLAGVMTSYLDLHAYRNKKHIVFEYKTTARTPSNLTPSLTHKKQAIIYEKALQAEYGKYMDSLEYWIIYAVFLKKEIKYIPMKVDFSEFTFQEDVIGEIWNTIRQLEEVERKCSYNRVLSDQVCSWCDFRALCLEESEEGLIIDNTPTHPQHKILEQHGISAVGMTRKEAGDRIDLLYKG